MGAIKIREDNQKRSRVLARHEYRNTLKCSRPPAESVAHRVMKFWLTQYALEHEIDFSTEVSFSDGSRADVVFNDWCVAFEVLHTEDLKRFETKKYPLPTIPVPSTLPAATLLAMLRDLDTLHGSEWSYHRERLITQIRQGQYRLGTEPQRLEEYLGGTL